MGAKPARLASGVEALTGMRLKSILHDKCCCACQHVDRAGEAVGAKPARLASGGAALARDAAAASAAASGSGSDAGGGGGGCGASGGPPAASGGDATGLVLAWSAASPLDDVPRRGFTHLYGVRLKVTFNYTTFIHLILSSNAR